MIHPHDVRQSTRNSRVVVLDQQTKVIGCICQKCIETGYYLFKGDAKVVNAIKMLLGVSIAEDANVIPSSDQLSEFRNASVPL